MHLLKKAFMRTPLLFLAVVAMVLLPYGTSVADVFKDINELKEKVGDMEKKQAELYHSLEEKKQAGGMKEIAERIHFGGLVELEGHYEKSHETEDNSDLVLATVQLGVEAEIHERVKSSVIFLYEEDDTPLDVDEGIIWVDMRWGLSFVGGKMYIPFGKFNTHFISDPLVLEVAETNESAAMFHYVEGPAEFKVGIFNGELDDGGNDQIQDVFLSVDVKAHDMLTFGLYAVTDMGDSDNLTSMIQDLNGSSYRVEESVPGFGGYISANYGPYMLDVEYLRAKRNFSIPDLGAASDGNGMKPMAYNVEFALAVDDVTEIALKYEGSKDFTGFPERQYGVAFSRGIFKNVTGSLEYLRGKYESESKRTLLTAQLALEF